MKNVELYFKAIDKGKFLVPEELIALAYEYAEKPVSLFQIKHEYDELLESDKMSGVVEDYILSLLSGRAKPLKRRVIL